jgi:hypothetical protein
MIAVTCSRSGSLHDREFDNFALHGMVMNTQTKQFILMALLLQLQSAIADDKIPNRAKILDFSQGLSGQIVTTDVTLQQDIHAPSGTAITLGADGITLDCAGHSITGGGTNVGVVIIDHSNVSIKNCKILGFEKAIYIASSDGMNVDNQVTDNSVTENVIRNNNHGVFMMWSNGASISNNQIIGNSDSAISITGHPRKALYCSNNTVIFRNEISFNRRGLVSFCSYLPHEGTVVEDNTFSFNTVSVTDRFEHKATIKYISNTFTENLTTLFIKPKARQDIQPGNPVEFSFTLHNSDGSACEDFKLSSLETSPLEEVSFSRSENQLNVKFIPQREGLYSSIIYLNGCGQKSISQRFWFGEQKSITYYLNPGDRRDVGTLLGQPPEAPHRVWCTMWIEAGIRLPPPEEGIAKVTGFSSSMWSSFSPYSASSPYESLWGIEFDHTYSRRGDAYVVLEGKYAEGHVLVSEEIRKGPFIYQQSDWQNMAIKYWGLNPDWTYSDNAPSSVQMDYIVSSSPRVLSISNRNAWLLSATTLSGSSNAYEVEMNGHGPTTLTLIVSDEFEDYSVNIDDMPCNLVSNCKFEQKGNAITIHTDLSMTKSTISLLTG